MIDSTKRLSSRKQNCLTWTSAKEWFPENKWVSKKQRRETELNITMWCCRIMAGDWLIPLPLRWSSWVYFWHTATHTQGYPAAVFCHFLSIQQDGERQPGLKCLVWGNNIMTRPVLKPQPSRIRTINRRSHLTIPSMLYVQCGRLKNPHTIRKV